MFTRSKNEVAAVEWGNGTSHRLLVEADNMGFAVAHTLVRAGTESKLEYRRNLEACYCIKGSGNVEDTEGNLFAITPGVIYALDGNEPHFLRASEHEDLELISVFNPPIRGDEKHVLSDSGFSTY
ncbi:ectoine synthase [Arthrobacter silvisoli]|uniref:ectoine synthase n=1 Tax=Arthrobacter silvisoli TaxID=2291022 RepID=UPI000E21A28D|nr:ectoine synthase [Arthrobacter silvisoli]